MYRKILLTLLTAILTPLTAATISGAYDVSFSVFGKIGEATVFMKEEKGDYHIHIDGKLTGFAASLGQNRRESHDSYGRIVDGIFVPDKYVKKRLSDKRDETTVYTFDHVQKKVTKQRTKVRRYTMNRFDAATMAIAEVPQIEKQVSESVMPYYAANDLMSLFFNVRHFLKEIPRGGKSIQHSVGATNDKGEVVITNPEGKKRAKLAKLMPDNQDRLITVVVDQDIFESDKGELYINLDKDYLAIEAMLKDVLLFGDIRAKRVSHSGIAQ
ncbi:MAG: DUF3108 domain-containing protein [Sulfurimonadaceae bacterium]|nr:DUF3108 domain-containing protein [Sulfurimonadaceae bacterium]